MYQLPIENFELVFKNRSNMVTFYQMNTEVLNMYIYYLRYKNENFSLGIH